MTATAATSPKSPAAGTTPRRRLAYLLSSYPAVSHTFFLNEIQALRALGFEIDVASINEPVAPGGGLATREASEASATYYVKATPKLRVLLLLLKTLFIRPRIFLRGLPFALRLSPWNLYATLYSLAYFVEAVLVGDWMRRNRHNHLHIHFGGAVATVGMIASVAWEFPYSLMIHGPEEFFNIEKALLVPKIEHARFVLCISNFCRSQLLRICSPAHWSKLHVVRLGVDPELFSPRPCEPDPERIELLCVGRLVPDKGQLILLQACAELLGRGHGLRVRFVGEGPDRPRLESFIAEHKLATIARLEGALSHDKTRERLRSAGIFVLPSFAEGVPVALMEAMAMEVPCISTFVGGIPELIEDAVSGILVPPSSPQALANAIERLALEHAFRARIAAAGRCRVLERYNLGENVVTLASRFESYLPELVPARA